MEKIIVEINNNSEVLINGIVIDDEIFAEDKSDYILVERLEQIDNLIGFIRECGYGREGEKFLMKEDLEYLMSLEDEYIFSNINSNLFVAQSDSPVEFFGICVELLRLNGWNTEKADSFLRTGSLNKSVNIKFLKQGLLKAKVPSDLKEDLLADYCKKILDNASDEELIEAMADAGAASDGSYPHGMFDADCFQVEMVEDTKTFDQLFQTKSWEYFGEEDAILELEAENKSMGNFLEKQLGFSCDSVCDIAHDSTKLYSVHVVCDNELKHYKLYTKVEEAQAAYIRLCEEWYSDDGFENFSNENELVDMVTQYDSYYGSEQYNDAGDNAHVTWELINV